jgi:uncharacterized protein YjiK
MRAAAGAVAGLAAAFALGCSPGQTPAERDAALDRRAQQVALRAAAADSAAESGHPSDAPIARWILPYHYSEISGLTLTSDGRLLALGDENSEIWEIDYRRGVITSRFTVGDPAIQADFEGLVAVDRQLYLMDSKGRIYRTTEGADRSTVPYDEFDPGLGHECEFEGISFDPAAQALLMACKHVGKGAPSSALVIYRVSAADRQAQPVPIVVPIGQLNARGAPWKKFEASEITRDPRTGNFLVMSSLQHGLVEITPAGAVVRVANIPGNHRQPEGAAITPEGRLIVSDEAAGDRPVVTVYPAIGS